MTPAELLLTVTASAAGWAIFVLGLLVLHAMDLRHGRWFTAASWLGTTLAGVWLAVVPGWTHEPPAWPLVCELLGTRAG